MPPKPGLHAVKFIMLDFIGVNWRRTKENLGDALICYTAIEASKLVVVSEESGEMFTELYEVPKHTEVWVVDQVVHIPARVPKRKKDNQVEFQ